MKIQHITFSGKQKNFSNSDVTETNLSTPKHFREFDVNLIDLTDVNLWYNKTNKMNRVNSSEDLNTVGKLINDWKKCCEIVILLPKNAEYNYGCNKFSEAYEKSSFLKDMIDELQRDILDCFHIYFCELVYGEAETKIQEEMVNSDFYFGEQLKIGENLTTSIGGSPTTKKYEDVIYTTLSIKTDKELKAFLTEVKIVREEKEIMPDWMGDICMFNDDELREKIRLNDEKINELEEKNNQNQEALQKNERYESILYTQSDELTDVVTEILVEIFNVDLSGFQDEGKEDCRFKVDDTTCLFEFKGQAKNVNNSVISQLRNHVDNYADKCMDETEVELVKGILIINHQKDKPLEKREPVNEKQVKYAKRIDILVIETITLLKLLEKFKTSEITKEDIEKIFIENTGLLTLSDEA